MAKLSARGRTELIRVSKTQELDTPNQNGIVKRRATRAYMSDGHLLIKDDYWYADGIQIRGTWKVKGKAKTGKFTPEAIENIRTKANEKGWDIK